MLFSKGKGFTLMTKRKNDFYDNLLLPLLLIDDIEKENPVQNDGSLKWLASVFVIILSVLCCISQLFY